MRVKEIKKAVVVATLTTDNLGQTEKTTPLYKRIYGDVNPHELAKLGAVMPLILMMGEKDNG